MGPHLSLFLLGDVVKVAIGVQEIFVQLPDGFPGLLLKWASKKNFFS